MRVRCVSGVFLTSCVSLLIGLPTPATAADERADQAPSATQPPAKFIPTFAVCYSDAAGARSPEETARFDMLISSFGRRAARAWGRDGANSWQTLKKLNPSMTIALYAIGPGEYNTASWGQIGEGWDWLQAHHGKDTADRWIALGQKSGGYLQARPYPNERLMELANPNWRRYWNATIYDDYWGGRKGIDCQGADALFSDNTQYQMIWTGQWLVAGHPDQPDMPVSESRDEQSLQDQWRRATNQFLAGAVPYFAERNVKIVLNFGYMGQHPEYWKELDTLSLHPFAAMEEGGFVCPWGGDQRSFKTWDWPKRLDALRTMKNVKVLLNNHGGPFAGEGLARMDSPDANGTTGWEALWFSLTSFLLGYDDQSQNALMSFTVWGYREYHWFDEFDAAYLHLGGARGDYFRSDQAYLREFDDGWVAVNPGPRPLTGLRVPSGRARVLAHHNFKQWRDSSLVTTFDLKPLRGVILLREDRQAGNADNLDPSGDAPKP